MRPISLRNFALALSLSLGLALLLITGVAAHGSVSSHTATGMRDRLACYGPTGVEIFSADHTGRTNERYLSYHEVSTPTLTATETPLPGSNAACLVCHGDPDLRMTLPDGQSISLYIDEARFADSMHGWQNLECRCCHIDILEYPHPPFEAQDPRDFTLGFKQTCRQCHPGMYRQTQDSIHAEILQTKNRFAPTCTDCHGSHYITPPDHPRAKTSQTCAECHQPVYDLYRSSVHGAALVDEDNLDVPACVDCHGVHVIPAPSTALFREDEPEMCAHCHTDKDLMAKYGLSTDVYRTYEENFHGVTVWFYKTFFPTTWCYEAVCTDCHGIHDIQKTSNPASSVNSVNLLHTCQKCHPDAGPQFTSAWTGHHEPSPKTAPLVYYVGLFYKALLIPLVIGGMLVYVFLDLAHRLLNRGQRAGRVPWDIPGAGTSSGHGSKRGGGRV